LEVVNYQDRELHLVTYGADLVGQGRAVAPSQESDPKHEVGSWIQVPQREIIIPGRATAPVPFTLTVPVGTTPGDHLGAVVTSTIVGRSSSGLAVETRAALTVQVHIPGTMHAKLDIQRFDVQSVDGGRRFVASVRNMGNVLMTLHGRVRLSGDRDPVRLHPREIYVIPDGRATFTGVWHDTPRFARVDAVALFRAFVDDHQVDTFDSDTKTLWFVDWAIVAIVLLVIVAAVVAWFGTRGRRRRRRERRREEREVLREYWAPTGRD
jgi:hypothetical protein